jgi:hypothetical protein
MQPRTPAGPGTPTEPLPIAQVTTGMIAGDETGEEVGTVTGVQMPGTDVRPDGLPDAEADALVAGGYVRIEAGGMPTRVYYAAGGQIAGVTTSEDAGAVSLNVRTDDLRRAD